uniref:Cathepsin S-like n=1 Tax=Scleropages formosus TaxID=113540 RepID=A0A8C9R3J2_SCLFO
MSYPISPICTRMHVLLIVTALIMVVLCHTSLDNTLNGHWELWKKQHHKNYRNQGEEAYRRLVWEKTLRLIEKHNLEASQGLHSFTMGLNHLADRVTFSNLLSAIYAYFSPLQLFMHTNNTTLPDSVDWRTKGLVSPVRNQGSCGSCWAFSAAGALEGQMKWRTVKMIPLSPQNLVDCSTSYGNHGCKGGFLSKAFGYIIGNNMSISSSKGRCHYSVLGKAGDCRTVSAVGPVSIGINSLLPSFHHYRGGIYNDIHCSNLKINHAVLVVGYGTDKGQDYWLVRNSWGTAWGEKGFVRVARNKNNLCGIANFAIYPTVCS